LVYLNYVGVNEKHILAPVRQKLEVLFWKNK